MTQPPIAIVGLACRLPGGADTPARLWSLLSDGVDAVGEVPAERWHPDAFYHPDPAHPGTSYTKAGAFLPLSTLSGFDAGFFGISPHEAERMSPHQRLLLEMAWEGLEDAGWKPSRLAGSQTGVYIGMCGDEYGDIGMAHPASMNAFSNIGGAGCVAANRVSHVLDLHGPSLVVDTACSSSLVALHLACSGLWQGDCTTAIVGASTVNLRPGMTVGFAKASMLSRTGKCHAFAAEADGFVRAEGGAVAILKPLAQAEADGDRIYAVIAATGVNTAGHTTGISLPSMAAQAALFATCCRQGGIDPAQVHYIEAHGTGTAAGDPLECAALGQVYGTAAGRTDPLRIGSIKSQVGHLEGASGMAGLLKLTLALWTGRLPANLHLEHPNPKIPFQDLGLRPLAQAEAWPSDGPERAAGISSFGFGGSNAHALLRPYRGSVADPLAPASTPTSEVPHLVPISAASPAALHAWVERLLDLLRQDPTRWSVAGIAGSLASHREAHPHRLAVVAASIAELTAQLAAWLAGESPPGVISQRTDAHPPRIAAVFCGNGPPWWGMARRLLAQEPVFSTAVAEVAGLYQQASGVDLLEELGRDEATSRMDHTDIAQPALFAIQVGLWRLWRSWGIAPGAVTGHSVGEVAAAWAAGCLDLPTAVRVIYHRSRCQELTRGTGTMAALGLAAPQARELCAAQGAPVGLAAENSPSAVTISGDSAPVAAVVAACAAQGRFARVLPLAYAFHSPHMEPVRADLLASLAGLPTGPGGDALFYSTVTGGALAADQLGAQYWWDNIRLPVRFADAIHALIDSGCTAFVEIGPHPVLKTYLAENLASSRAKGTVVESLKRKEDDRRHLLRQAAILWTHGSDLVWAGLGLGSDLLRLPPYAWDRQTYWHLPVDAVAGPTGPVVHPLLGRLVAGSDPLWECQLDAHRLPWLGDHRVGGVTVVPGTAFLEAAYAAARLGVPGDGAAEVDGLVIHRALIPDATGTLLRTALDRRSGRVTFHACASGATEWTLHAEAIARRGGRSPTAAIDVAAIRGRCPRVITAAEHYATAARIGLDYGPAFRGIAALGAGDGEAFADLHWPETAPAHADLPLHPALMDAAVQVVFACLAGTQAYLPVRMDRVRVSAPLHGPLFVHLRLTHMAHDAITVALRIGTADGVELVRIDGFRLQRFHVAQAAEAGRFLYRQTWETLPHTTAVVPAGGLPAGDWLIFADRGGLAERFCQQVADGPGRTILIGPGSAGTTSSCGPGTGRFHARRGDPAHTHRLLSDLGRTVWRGIIDCSALDHGDSGGVAAVPMAARATTTQLIALVQALTSANIVCAGLTVLTRGVHSHGLAAAPTGIAQSALWGAVRCIANELPELHLRIIDLPQGDDDHVARQRSRSGRMRIVDLPPGDDNQESATLELLRRELAAPTAETETILRGGNRLVPRLVSADAAATYTVPVGALPAHSTARLAIGLPGQLTSLHLTEAACPAPAPGQVRVQVEACGVNFKDVMIAMGLLTGDVLEHGYSGPALGMEFAGIVQAVGAGVSWKRGDRVAGIAPHSMATQVLARGEDLLALPDGVSAASAATMPIVFLTAWYALAEVARLAPGETVLVHGAAGGVGLAAIQVAHALGATVIGSAGSEEKRAVVHACGVATVIDSRDRGFDQAVLDATGGAGVDVVLNSLAGDAIARGVSVLKPFGRFLELGKRDFMADTQLGLRPFRRNISFHGIDVDQLLVDRPRLAARLFADLTSRIADGTFRPLPAVTVPMARAEEAFRTLQQSKQIGKVVLTLGDATARVAVDEHTPVVLAGDGTWLVTGGLGGFGLASARWLVAHGVRHLLLVSRRGAETPGAAEAARQLAAAGAQVVIRAGDVTDAEAVRRLLAEASAILPPITGILHAAMVLDDGIVRNLAPARIAAVMQPKVDGAWILHSLTRKLPIRHFVVYSSIASLIGNPGQTAYVAANAFLETLCETRRRLGLPGTAMCWGPIADTGVFARAVAAGGHQPLERAMRPMTADESLTHLGATLRCNIGLLGACRATWGAMPGLRLERLSGLMPSASAETAAGPDTAALIATASGEALRLLIEERLAGHLSRILGLGSATLDRLKPVGNLGLDSLMAVELGHVLEAELGREVPVMTLIKNSNTEDMARELCALVETARSTAK